MTTVLLTSFSIGRMVRCDPLPPFSLSLPARRFITRAALSLRPRIAPPGPRPSLLSVVTALRLHRSPPPHPALSALHRRLSPTTPLLVSATLRPRRSPSAPLRGSPSAPLSVCAALRYLRSPSSLLSFLAALLSRRSQFSQRSAPSAPLSPAAPAICTLPPLAPADLLCSRLSPVTRRSKLCRVRTT